MTMTVSDSSPLICLSRIGKLDLVRALFGRTLIPQAVFDEVVLAGKREGREDATLVEAAVKSGWVKVERIGLSKELRATPFLGAGESEAIELARKTKAVLLVDDGEARLFAENMGVSCRGTIFVLLQAQRKRLIDKEEAKNVAVELVQSGFRVSPEVFARWMQEIDRL